MPKGQREEWKTWQGVFDAFTERVLFKLSSQGHFDHLRTIISPGKEAVVYEATKKDGTRVAVKILRDTAPVARRPARSRPRPDRSYGKYIG